MFGTAELWRTAPPAIVLQNPFPDSLPGTTVHPHDAGAFPARVKGVMVDVEQVIDDEPHQLVGGHRLLPVESLQINESRKAAQRALPAHIEIAEREFPERAVDGFAPAA